VGFEVSTAVTMKGVVPYGWVEFIYGVPGRLFGDESPLSARIRVGSRLKRVPCYVFIDVRFFCTPGCTRTPG
jgi:hypothetical protein